MQAGKLALRIAKGIIDGGIQVRLQQQKAELRRNDIDKRRVKIPHLLHVLMRAMVAKQSGPSGHCQSLQDAAP